MTKSSKRANSMTLKDFYEATPGQSPIETRLPFKSGSLNKNGSLDFEEALGGLSLRKFGELSRTSASNRNNAGNGYNGYNGYKENRSNGVGFVGAKLDNLALHGNDDREQPLASNGSQYSREVKHSPRWGNVQGKGYDQSYADDGAAWRRSETFDNDQLSTYRVDAGYPAYNSSRNFHITDIPDIAHGDTIAIGAAKDSIIANGIPYGDSQNAIAFVPPPPPPRKARRNGEENRQKPTSGPGRSDTARASRTFASRKANKSSEDSHKKIHADAGKSALIDGPIKGQRISGNVKILKRNDPIPINISRDNPSRNGARDELHETNGHKTQLEDQKRIDYAVEKDKHLDEGDLAPKSTPKNEWADRMGEMAMLRLANSKSSLVGFEGAGLVKSCEDVHDLPGKGSKLSQNGQAAKYSAIRSLSAGHSNGFTPVNGAILSRENSTERRKLKLQPRTLPLDNEDRVLDTNGNKEDRPKLKLKPRTKPLDTRLQTQKSSNIFGDARPRELVLKERGVDVSVGDHTSPLPVNTQMGNSRSASVYSGSLPSEPDDHWHTVIRNRQRSANSHHHRHGYDDDVMFEDQTALYQKQSSGDHLGMAQGSGGMYNTAGFMFEEYDQVVPEAMDEEGPIMRRALPTRIGLY